MTHIERHHLMSPTAPQTSTGGYGDVVVNPVARVNTFRLNGGPKVAGYLTIQYSSRMQGWLIGGWRLNSRLAEARMSTEPTVPLYFG